MTTNHQTFERNHHSCGAAPGFLKSFTLSLAILSPSFLSWMYLMENRAPLPYPYLIAYAILLWTVLDFIIVVLIEPYRNKFSTLTIPAFIGTISIVLLFVITESINRFFKNMGYEYLTPFVFAGVLLIYIAILREKNIALKCHLSVNSIALAALWAMGVTDKVTMPF